MDVLRFDDIFKCSPGNTRECHHLSAVLDTPRGSGVNAASIGPYQVAKLTEAVDDLTLRRLGTDPPALRGPRSAAMLPLRRGWKSVSRMFSIDVIFEYVESWKSENPTTRLAVCHRA